MAQRSIDAVRKVLFPMRDAHKLQARQTTKVLTEICFIHIYSAYIWPSLQIYFTKTAFNGKVT